MERSMEQPPSTAQTVQMQEVWIATMNVHEANYNLYFSEERANEAVHIMRQRLGKEGAEHFKPHVIKRVVEGEAFGADLNAPRKRQYQEVFL